MKNYIITGLIAITVCICACTKTKPSGPVSSWAIGAKTYSASAFTNNTIAKTVSVSNGAYSIYVYFAAMPASGNYTIVNHHYIDSTVLYGNQISIEANTNAADAYLSSGAAGITAHVDVSGDKINITIPPVWAKHYDYYGLLPDSLQISGQIKEY